MSFIYMLSIQPEVIDELKALQGVEEPTTMRASVDGEAMQSTSHKNMQEANGEGIQVGSHNNMKELNSEPTQSLGDNNVQHNITKDNPNCEQTTSGKGKKVAVDYIRREALGEVDKDADGKAEYSYLDDYDLAEDEPYKYPPGESFEEDDEQ